MSAWTCRSVNGKAAQKIVPPRLRIPCWKGRGADSEEKHEPVSDIDTAVVDSLTCLTPDGRLEKQTSQGVFSKPKMRFQSFFMLITVHPSFLASSNSSWVKVPTLVSGRPSAGP